MNIASNMVAELVRLKDVSKWKIWAGDATDDFSDKKVPVRVFKAAQQVKQNAEHVASQVSEALQPSSTPLTESMASSAKSVLSEASSHAAEVLEDSSSLAASVISKASDVAADNAAKASSAYKSPKKVYGGANAQILVEARQVILDQPLDDDDETYSEKFQDRAADLSRIVSQALLGPTKTTGSIESMSSLASEQYVKALAAASSALYGTEQPAVQSATSVASEKFDQAFTAASYAIYGTPMPNAVIKSIQVQVRVFE